MRFVATMVLWLVTTVALAAAVPAMWAQKNIVDANGYAAFARSAWTRSTATRPRRRSTSCRPAA